MQASKETTNDIKYKKAINYKLHFSCTIYCLFLRFPFSHFITGEVKTFEPITIILPIDNSVMKRELKLTCSNLFVRQAEPRELFVTTGHEADIERGAR